ncbi:PASTA domain-containing protein [Dactylosporangium fulvum]
MVNCKVVGQPKSFVENDLRRKGFEVETVVDEEAETRIPGTVTKIEPCNEQPQGSKITLTVSKGSGGPGSKSSSAPAPGTSASGGSGDSSPEPNGNATSCPPGKMPVNGVCVGA